MSVNIIDDASAKDFKHLSVSADTKGRKMLEDDKYHRNDSGLSYPINGANYEKKPFGVALFGLGRIGMIHFLNLKNTLDIEILYVVEYDQARLNYVSFKYNVKAKMLTPDKSDQVYNDPNVDIVVVCTPTQAHEEIAVNALKAGKAVFCEKPLSYRYEGIKDCYQLAKNTGKTLFCSFNRRFDPTFGEIKQRVDNGEIGTVQVLKSCARDSPKPAYEYLASSGGIYHDCIVHDIDLICYVIGEYPTSVSSVGHSFDPKIAEIGDFDTVAINMKFPSGALGVIDVSRSSNYGYDQRLEVFGHKGMLTSGDIRPTTVELHNEVGTIRNPICYSFTSRYTDSYNFAFAQFLEEVKGKRKPIVTGQDVLAVSKIASACEKAAKEGRTVELSWN